MSVKNAYTCDAPTCGVTRTKPDGSWMPVNWWTLATRQIGDRVEFHFCCLDHMQEAVPLREVMGSGFVVMRSPADEEATS